MENRKTKEVILDGILFSTFEEYFENMRLIFAEDLDENYTVNLKELHRLLEAPDTNVLITWENADVSRRLFDEEEMAKFCEQYGEPENKQATLYDQIIYELERTDTGHICEIVQVDGMRMADYTFDHHKLSDIYTVEKITEDAYEEILELYRNNPEYFALINVTPTLETVKHDAEKLPEGIRPDRKFYVSFRDPDLVGIANIVLGYPREDTVWIDLFMINKELQGWSYGSEILRDMLDAFTAYGFVWTEIGVVEGNAPAIKFWKRNWFVDLHQDTLDDGIVVRHMIRGLQ